MSSPKKSAGSSATDEDSSRAQVASPQSGARGDDSTHENVGSERDDFQPPPSNTTRTSPLRDTIEAARIETSPFVTSSSRGGRIRQAGSPPSLEQDAAERAAWEAASQQLHNRNPMFSPPKRRSQPTRSPLGGTDQTTHKSKSKNSSMRRPADPFAASSEAAAELEQGFLTAPVGSFNEDSPPRGAQHDRRKLPQEQHHYTRYPPFYPPPPEHDPARPPYMGYGSYPYSGSPQSSPGDALQHYHYPPYPYPPPGYPPHPSYYQQPPPHIRHYEPHPGSQDAEQYRPPPVPMDWGTSPRVSYNESFAPPAPASALKRSGGEDTNDSSGSSVSTPEKKVSPRRGGDPFRSPTSSKDHLKSPMYQSSPNLSFSIIDTPTGNAVADYSPLGPSFANFSEDEPFTSGKLSLNQSSSEEERPFGIPKIKQRPTSSSKSPLSELFRSDLSSPFPQTSAPPESASALHGVTRSPMQSSTRAERKAHPSTLKIPDSGSGKPANIASATPKTEVTQHVTLRASPVAPSSEVKPRNLWHDQPSKNALRITLGQPGERTSMSAQRRSLEDINCMMRGQTPAARRGSATPSTNTTSREYPQQHYPRSYSMPPGYYPPPGSYPPHAPMATPMRADGGQTGYPAPISTGAGKAPTPYLHAPTSGMKSGRKSPPIAVSTGKENSSTSASATGQEKRGPCNCKKSRCLKLYCECFSARKYCKDCNCKDCNNLPEYEFAREKAIKQTLAKNRTAFEPRITGEHNMGCKCRRSQCLKKYCECFQAGVICNPKCKCVNCMNRADSQKLIDTRRKMKDKKGTEYAMRINEETWKKGTSQRSSLANVAPRPPLASPVGRAVSSPMHRGPIGMHGHMPPHAGHHPVPPPYMGAGYMGPPMMGTIGYSPMNVSPVTPAVHRSKLAESKPKPNRPVETPVVATEKKSPAMSPVETKKRSADEMSLSPAKPPRTPGVRALFDASSSRKKRKKNSVEEEPGFPYFGGVVPEQPKTTALAIFSFLSNDDIYKAALVCKQWNQLAMDEELWTFS